MESNDSPEIPDRGGDIRHPRPPFGDYHEVIRVDVVRVEGHVELFTRHVNTFSLLTSLIQWRTAVAEMKVLSVENQDPSQNFALENLE